MTWRPVTAALAVVLALAGLWGAGFAHFNVQIRQPAASLPPKADGIVVLTGGAERIETALRLLAEGRAPVLLVSGVGRGAELAEIAHRLQLDPAALAERVTLGRTATTTIGNALETASWARAHRVHSLIVVTAGYHMPRALLEIGRELPGVALHPAPVQPPAMRGPLDLSTAKLLANEYDKLLAVRLGLTRFARAGEAN